jgi:hypothetical protein
VGDSPSKDGDLPFKEPVDAAELNLVINDSQGGDVQSLAMTQSASMAVDAQKASDEPARVEPEDQEPELSAARLIQQLSIGFDSLKELNFEGFKQIYPIFLIVFGSVVAGLLLLMVTNFLDSMNHLPVVGGLFQGIAELVGLVTVVRLITSNLLLQQRRAEVFARIAALKKDLLGGSD